MYSNTTLRKITKVTDIVFTAIGFSFIVLVSFVLKLNENIIKQASYFMLALVIFFILLSLGYNLLVLWTNHKTYNGHFHTKIFIVINALFGIVFYGFGYYFLNVISPNHFVDRFESSVSMIISMQYYSCYTFFTVGYGDIQASSDVARIFSMTEMFYAFIMVVVLLTSIKSFPIEKDE